MEEGAFIGNFACIDCTSSDALSIYQKPDGTFDGYCRSLCTGKLKFKSHTKLAKSFLGSELGIEVREAGVQPQRSTRAKVKIKKKKQSPISEEQKKTIKENTTDATGDFRGIRDQFYKRNGVRVEYDEETGSVAKVYYPCLHGKDKNDIPNLTGYKIRIVENKNFYSVGVNAEEGDLFGQWNCKGNKIIVFTGGEQDKLAAEQMIYDYRKARGFDKIAPIDTVSSIIGEPAAAKQFQIHYDFLDRYETIVINMDMDDPGQQALEAILEVAPADKVRVMFCPAKDANEALNEGLEQDYIRAIYQAQKPRLAGVVSGDEMWEALLEVINAPIIPLPPVFDGLSRLLCGGLPLGEIINILAASGIGKTTIINILIMYWIMNAPYKVGILSMEAGAGKFLMRLLSSWLKISIARLEDPEEKRKVLEENKAKCYELLKDENGEDRFYLVDDKGDLDTLDNMKRTIEKMIRQGGCKIIVIDPIQDALDSLSIEEQAAFVGWQKKIKARDGITFININHTRKSGGGGRAGSTGGELTEEDMQGTSALYKSGAVNIILTRDKSSDDPEIRNTTRVKVTKARDTGDTGPAGELFYEVGTATLYDKSKWLEEKGDFEGDN